MRRGPPVETFTVWGTANVRSSKSIGISPECRGLLLRGAPPNRGETAFPPGVAPGSDTVGVAQGRGFSHGELVWASCTNPQLRGNILRLSEYLPALTLPAHIGGTRKQPDNPLSISRLGIREGRKHGPYPRRTLFSPLGSGKRPSRHLPGGNLRRLDLCGPE